MTKQANIEKLSLNTLSEAVKRSQTVTEAREEMSAAIGATVSISGGVIKKVTRHEYLKLFIQPNDSEMTVFAEFPDPKEVEKITAAKIRKTSKVSLTGRLTSFGFASVCLTNCRLQN